MDKEQKEIIEQIISVYMTEQLPEETEALVQSWLINDKYEQEKNLALLNVWDTIEAEPVHDADEVLCAIKLELGLIGRKKRSLPRRFLIMAAAVIVPLILVAGVALYYITGVEQTVFGEFVATAVVSTPIVLEVVYSMVSTDNMERQIILDDGTEIWMNRKSTLSYPSKRRAKIEGEGFFDVEKIAESDFVIDIEPLSITVVGTNFNIKNFPESNSIIVSLYKGILDIGGPNISIRLGAGKELAYNKVSGDSFYVSFDPNTFPGEVPKATVVVKVNGTTVQTAPIVINQRALDPRALSFVLNTSTYSNMTANSGTPIGGYTRYFDYWNDQLKDPSNFGPIGMVGLQLR